MAHVWNVIDGDIYVSKNGDDVTGDGSMAAPYASINKATTVGVAGNKIVIGTGVWQEARGSSTNTYIFIGDGEVVIDQKNITFFRTVNNQYDSHKNLKFINAKRAYDNSYYIYLTFENCYFDFLSLMCHTTNGVCEYRFKNCYGTLYLAGHPNSTSVHLYIENCTFLDVKNSNVSSGIYVNFKTLINTIIYTDLITSGIISIISGNIFGVITNNTSIIGFSIYSLNPKFNNPDIGDYTLQSDSPCLFAGKNNTTIGAFGLGYSFDANSSEFTKEGGAVFSQTTLVDDIIRTSQVINGVTRFLFQLASGHASGNVESAWIDLQTIRYLLITRLFANIIYNAAGVATSRPDNMETAGEKAVFYDFELKYCNEESEKATAVWKNVIWNKAVTIDNAGRGNADAAFVASEAQYISARFIKIKLYMTEA